MKKALIIGHSVCAQSLAIEIAKHQETAISVMKTLNEIVEEEKSIKITNPRRIDFNDETMFRIIDSPTRGVVPPKFYKRKK